MRKQDGVTLTGFVLVAAVVVFVLLFAFKVAPAYFEYYSIQKQFKAIANDPNVRSGTRREIEGAFVARSTIENITAMGPRTFRLQRRSSVVLSAGTRSRCRYSAT